MPRTPKSWLQTRIRRWARRRQGEDNNPVVLHRGRIYILPTGAGIAYSILVFAMLLGSMNYNNNMGFALTFLLVGPGLVAMHHCQRTLLQLSIRYVGAQPVYAGQTARFRFQLNNRADSPRLELSTGYGAYESPALDLEPNARGISEIAVPTEHRGWVRIRRVRLATRYPFGLFRAWAWIHMDLRCLVYPKPADGGRKPPPMQSLDGGDLDQAGGDDDFVGLRSYHAGDSPRHIAWKAYARGQDLLVKQFAGRAVSTEWLDWDSLAGLGTEPRLSQLCRWILNAQSGGKRFGLRLPDQTLEPAHGAAHHHRCMRALALYDEPDVSDV